MSEAEPTRETHNPLGETGRRLRKAREAKRQSLSEVAECLHLRPSIVSAIEDGDYRQIPGELFLKGYVKSYARHLGLDEESTIELLERELEPLREQDERARIEHEHPLEEIQRRKEQRRRTGRWLALAAGIVVVVIAYLVFAHFGGSFQRESGGVSASAPSAGSQTTGNQTNSQTNSQTSAAMTAPATQANSGQSQSPAAMESSAPASTASATSQPGASAQPAATPAMASSSSPGNNPEISSGAGTSAGKVAAAAPAASPVAGQSGASQSGGSQTHAGSYTGATLTGTFGGDCWIEVKNGDGVEVVAALKRAGDKVYYRGPPPFHVVLGAVSQVTQMTYNGKPVDLKDYPSPGNRAEFVLGKKKD